MRKYFLEHQDYSFLAICPDDMVVDKQKFEQLVDDLLTYPNDIPVLCGFANREISGQYKDESTVSIKHLPNLKIGDRKYHCEPMQTFYDMSKKVAPIIQVKYAGFPCMIIRRDVVGQTSLATDGQYNGETKGTGCCIDVVFCNECAMLGIPIVCDSRCDFLHLKENDQHSAYQAFQTRFKVRKVWLQQKTQNV